MKGLIMLKWLLARLKEPSTYNGFAGVALAVGISEPVYTASSAIVAGIAGLVGVALSERAK